MNAQRDEPPGTGAPTQARPLGRLLARLRRVVPFALGVAATLTAIALYGLLAPGPSPLTQREVNDTVAHALASATPRPALSEQVYQDVQPSLVLIQTQSQDASGKTGGSLGSGVIVDTAGDILTSLHVVADATAITVTFADGSSSAAQIQVRQPDQDIAVLAADQLPGTLVPATLGNPRAVQVGSEAYVVGNPLGLYGSLTAGVVSGLDRSFQVPGSDVVLHGLFQIDAAVNPGNSGGPLLNRAGQVIGIVTGLVNPTKQDAFAGIGLAVPIDVAGGAAGLPQY